MSGKNRSQKVYLTVESTRIGLLPAGHYSLHIDNVCIEKGSIKVTARIISSLVLTSSNIIQLKQKEVKNDGEQA